MKSGEYDESFAAELLGTHVLVGVTKWTTRAGSSGDDSFRQAVRRAHGT